MLDLPFIIALKAHSLKQPLPPNQSSIILIKWFKKSFFFLGEMGPKTTRLYELHLVSLQPTP